MSNIGHHNKHELHLAKLEKHIGLTVHLFCDNILFVASLAALSCRPGQGTLQSGTFCLAKSLGIAPKSSVH